MNISISNLAREEGEGLPTGEIVYRIELNSGQVIWINEHDLWELVSKFKTTKKKYERKQ